MKKLSFTLIAIFLLFGLTEASSINDPFINFSKDNTNTLDIWSHSAPSDVLRRKRRPGRRNVYQKGKSFLAFGYGYPNFSMNYLMTYSRTMAFSLEPKLYGDFKNSTLGVFHFRYEYALWDIFGLSMRTRFSSYDVSWNLLVPGFDDDGNEITRKIKSGYNGITADMAIRFDWHIYTSMKIDFYTGMGVGYSFNIMNYYTSDKDLAEDPNKDIPYFSIPVAFESTTGIRYFFTSGFGIYAEIGYAQSAAEVGLTFRF